MRNKILKLLTLVLIVALSACVFASCGSCNGGNDSGGGSHGSQDSGSGGSSDTGGQSGDKIDTVAPIITIEGEKSFTVKAGERVTLPAATVYDETDGDITDKLQIISANGTKFCSLENGGFYSEVGGTHEVLYCAVDAAGNDAYESVFVRVTPLTEEQTLDGDNDLSVLDEGGVFVENFEKGSESPLVKGSFRDYYTLTASKDAISGNSLIIDYTKVDAARGNKITFSNMMPYLKGGVWSVSFDVKLVSGKAFEDFYFAYSLGSDDSSVSYGRKSSLVGMSVGEVRKVTYKAAIDIESANEGNYVFYVYYSAGASANAKLALDNFTFRREDLPYKSCVPTVAELEKGFTYDWTENAYTALGVSEKVSGIEDEDARNAMSQSGDFGETAIRLYSSSRIFGLSSVINPQFFKAGRVYTLRIPYYQKSADNPSYLSVVNGHLNNRTIGWDIFTATGRVSVAEIRYVIKPGEKEFIIYNAENWENLWIGNITITLADRADENVENEYYSPTDEELADGFTYKMEKGAVAELVSEYADAEYYSLEKGKIPDEWADLSSDIFKGDYALRLGGYYGVRIAALDGRIDENKYYRVAFNAVLKGDYNAGNLHALVLDANGKQINENAETFAMIPLGGGAYTFECNLKGYRGGKFLSVYSSSEFTFYIGSLELQVSVGSAVKEVSREEVEQSDGYTLDFDNEKLMLDSCTYNFYLETVKENSHTYLSVRTVENMPASCLALRSFNDVFVVGRTYAVTLKFAKGAKIPATFLLLQADKNGTQISNESYAFTKTDNADFDEYTASFVAKKGVSFVCVFTKGQAEWKVKSVTVKKIPTAVDGKAYQTAQITVNGAEKVTVGEGDTKPAGEYIFVSLQSGKRMELSGFDEFLNGKIYTVELNGYGVKHSASTTLVALGENGEILCSVPLGVRKSGSDGKMQLRASFIAGGVKKIGILAGGEENAYLSSVRIYEVNGGNAAAIITENGAVIDLSLNLLNFINDCAVTSAVYTDASAFGYKAGLNFTADGVGVIAGLIGFNSSILKADCSYGVKIISTSIGSLSTFAVVGDIIGEIKVKQLGGGLYEYSFDFTPTADNIQLYNDGETDRDFTVFNITVTQNSQDTRNEESLTDRAAKTEKGFVSDFNNKKLGITDGEWVTVSPYGSDNKYLWKFTVKTSDGKYNFDPAFLSGLDIISNADCYTTLYFKGFVEGDLSSLLLLPMRGDKQVGSKYFKPIITKENGRTILKYVFLGVSQAESMRLFASSADITMFVEEIGVKTQTLPAAGVMDATVTRIIAPAICDVDDFKYQAESMIILDRGKVALIDGGDVTSDSTRFLLASTLRNLGVTKIDVLILTHPHSDHTGALTYIIERFDIGAFVYKAADYRPQSDGGRVIGSVEMFNEMNAVLSAVNAKVNTDAGKPQKIDPVFGQKITLKEGNDAGVLQFFFNQKVFAKTEAVDGNYFSMTVSYSVGDYGVLYAAGDLADEYTSVYADFYDPSITETASKFAIWQVNHHGSAGPYSAVSLIEKLAPEYAFVAGRRDNLKDATLNKIKSAAGNADIYYAQYGAEWTVDIANRTVTADENYEHDEGDDDFRPLRRFTADDIGDEGEEGATLIVDENNFAAEKLTNLTCEYVTAIAGVDESGLHRYFYAHGKGIPTSVSFGSYAGVFVAGNTYKFTLVMAKVTSTRYFEILFQSADGKGQFTPQAFDVTPIDEFWSEYSVYFTANDQLNYLTLFDYNDSEKSVITEFYIKQINLKRIAASDIPAQRTYAPGEERASFGKTPLSTTRTVGDGEVSGVPAGTYTLIDLGYGKNFIINAFNGKIIVGNYYSVEVHGYETGYNNGLNFMFFKNTFYGANAVRVGRQVVDGVTVLRATLLAGEESAKLGFFMQNNATETFYATKIVITDEGKKNLVTATEKGFKADFTAGDTISYDHDFGYSSVSFGTCEGKTALRVTGYKACALLNVKTACASNLKVGSAYKFRFRTKGINKSNFLIAGNAPNVSSFTITAVDGMKETFDFTSTFTLRAGDPDALMFFSNAAINRDFYIFEMELTLIEE